MKPESMCLSLKDGRSRVCPERVRIFRHLLRVLGVLCRISISYVNMHAHTCTSLRY